jgi:hypothetical protein
VLYYYPESEAESQRRMLVQDRERLLPRAEAFFGKTLTSPILLLLYPSFEDSRPYR